MHAIREEDVERFREWIDPDHPAGESGMAVRAERKNVAARPAEGGVEIESAGAPHRYIRRRRNTRQHIDCLCFEYRRTAAQQHAAVEREVVDGGEESRVSCYAAHPTRSRIVHDAAQHAFGSLFGGGDTCFALASRRRSSRRAAGATK